MNIRISGRSGQLGSALLVALRERDTGHQLIGISRSPEKLHLPQKLVLANYDNPETLAAAYKRLDRLLLIPSAELRPGVRERRL